MAQQPKQPKRGKKCKRPDTRPARNRYWESGRLALKKIRNLVRAGYSPRDALRYWESVRKRHYGKMPALKKIDRLA